MTIIVCHGDNTAASRTALQQELTRERDEGHEIVELDGVKLLAKDLSSALGTANLFAPDCLVIENLLSRLRSKEKDACLAALANFTGDKNIILWDKKSVTKAVLSKLGKNTKVTEFKSPAILFTFLDSIVPGNAKRALTLLHELAKSTDDILIFTMLSRHITNLLIVDSGTDLKFAPWQIGKLKSQAKPWTPGVLVEFHDKLIKIDSLVKTGATKQSYLDHLDILLIKLLG